MKYVTKHLNPPTILALTALVFAITGASYAATGGAGHVKTAATISKSKRKASKSLRGPAGPRGATGAAGPAGPAGPAGAKGENGASGAAGGKGATGPQGNPGPAGPEGKQGEPWTAGGTLPSGKSLKGEWSLAGSGSGPTVFVGSFSFALPLKEPPVKHYVNVKGKEPVFNATTKTIEQVTPTGCVGNAEDPGAAPGNLCVFASQEENSFTETDDTALPAICSFDVKSPVAGNCVVASKELSTASRFGFGMETVSENPGPINMFGTWAVTAE